MGTSPSRVTIRPAVLKKIYKTLFVKFGPQHWWPAKTPFEVVVGAILVQNTNWTNTAAAIKNLKTKKLLNPQKLKNISHKRLAAVIRQAGYFNVKARRLKNFIDFLFDKYSGRISTMAKEDSQLLRRQLLSVNGIGPETADSILLYALNKSFFVVDAYTKRILLRHKLILKDATYDEVQEIFMKSLIQNTKLFNEYHALIVHLAKKFCKRKPLCKRCPLNYLTPILT
ncbi:MAG: endonuclease III domain-containing protein [Candidatus Aceula meridiana]|nr:endonuclease III domain-containing protein [Candidatus Aceula meridiana]